MTSFLQKQLKGKRSTPFSFKNKMENLYVSCLCLSHWPGLSCMDIRTCLYLRGDDTKLNTRVLTLEKLAEDKEEMGFFTKKTVYLRMRAWWPRAWLRLWMNHPSSDELGKVFDSESCCSLSQNQFLQIIGRTEMLIQEYFLS